MNKIRDFNEEEIKFILANCDKLSLNKVRKTLNCSQKALTVFAENNNITFQKSIRWTEDDLDKLIQLSKTCTLEEISKIIDKSEKAIYQKACRMNLELTQERRLWSKEDDDYLKQRWGSVSIEFISKKLNRSIYSIKVRATRLNLGPMYSNNPELLSIKDISEIMNVSRDRIKSTWMNRGLNLKRKKLTRKYSCYYVKWEEFLEFLKDNQDLWDSRKMEYNIFGEEEDWLIEKRNNDKTFKNKEYKKWTKQEIDAVELLFNKNKTPEEIADRLNRSENSVRIVLRELGYSYKMPIHWKGKELKYLRENYKDMSYEEIAKTLGRTKSAVQAKAQQLGYKKRNK